MSANLIPCPQCGKTAPETVRSGSFLGCEGYAKKCSGCGYQTETRLTETSAEDFWGWDNVKDISISE